MIRHMVLLETLKYGCDSAQYKHFGISNNLFNPYKKERRTLINSCERGFLSSLKQCVNMTKPHLQMNFKNSVYE